MMHREQSVNMSNNTKTILIIVRIIKYVLNND